MRVFITGVEGRVAAANVAKGQAERFFGTVHYVMGVPISGTGETGLAVNSLQCNDKAIVDSVRGHVPGFFELETMTRKEFGENRERVLDVQHLGTERQFMVTVKGIVDRPAAGVKQPA